MGLFTEKWFTSRKTFFAIFFGIIIIFAGIYFALDYNEETIDGKTTKFNYNSIQNNTFAQKFINKIYLSATTLTTLGYGDITPIHPISMILVTIQTLFTFVLITELIR